MIRRFIAKWIYFLYEALRKIRRHLTNNALTVLTISLALFVFSIFIVIGTKISSYVKISELRLNRIDVYLSPDLSNKEVDFIKQNLLRFKQVKAVKFISGEMAKNYFLKQLGSDKELLTDVVIPRSFEVILNNRANNGFVNKIRQFSGVIDVYYEKELVKHLYEIAHTIRFLGYVILIVLAAAVLLIIGNTIRLSLYQFKEEIKLMLLVGATNWFIRWPFVIVGFLQGLLGAIIALILTKAFLYYVIQNIQQLVKYVENVQITFTTALYLVVIGAGLGVFGSLIALRKFFKIVDTQDED